MCALRCPMLTVSDDDVDIDYDGHGMDSASGQGLLHPVAQDGVGMFAEPEQLTVRSLLAAASAAVFVAAAAAAAAAAAVAAVAAVVFVAAAAARPHAPVNCCVHCC